MTRSVILDSGPLAKIAHPRPNRDIAEWYERILRAGVRVVIAEIVDYEIRRNFILEGLTRSIDRLNRLETRLTYLPLNTAAMLRAAQLWAEARRQGHPTADPKELDADVILAAQAEQAGATVVTENPGHLSLFLDACTWQETDFLPAARAVPKNFSRPGPATSRTTR
ncbi:MAG: PIN domain-containing protein [Acidobacteriota bacterium]